MRPLLISIALMGALAVALPSAALAQADRPTDLQPIPEPPPPPEPLEGGVSVEPQVTIIQRGEDTVEEHRINGKLYMVKVTPPHGTPYYLMDENGSGAMTRYDDLDSGLRVPKWVIFSFD
ncbi:MAG: DUF2782 domain-containing protein [Gammaproteobacteria bacterium]|jgi:hypothetical protein|nr:DUF2782 domain-containing protein [Gammaproteobacteria bacterium]MBU0771262.1 DUF2782 domain-containing protein [Gammaproteobacteria bacterium]MBU0858129.1 DUF2782 domain-containing protein [Gammaproteobacteria bacterium]MBU1847172.1 DUF2782 domain-containing protein [Gammaproteobacteria bacterium]